MQREVYLLFYELADEEDVPNDTFGRSKRGDGARYGHSRRESDSRYRDRRHGESNLVRELVDRTRRWSRRSQKGIVN
jgi:hypothetical protein